MHFGALQICKIGQISKLFYFFIKKVHTHMYITFSMTIYTVIPSLGNYGIELYYYLRLLSRLPLNFLGIRLLIRMQALRYCYHGRIIKMFNVLFVIHGYLHLLKCPMYLYGNRNSLYKNLGGARGFFVTEIGSKIGKKRFNLILDR